MLLKNTYYIVGLIDDNPAKWNCSISGVKILGNRDKIQEVCKKYNVQEIFFSITNISPENKKELLHICQETNAKIRILPSTEDIIKNKNVLDNHNANLLQQFAQNSLQSNEPTQPK
jgi:FlaA1/EpsC-like NDP-sugar epimerase